MFWLGCFAFLLFFLSDINDLSLHKKPLIFLFPLGAVLLAASCALSLDLPSAPLRGPIWQAVCWISFALFAALEIYTLFFAFSASDGYTKPGERRRAYTRGVYSLCRHPGVIWLALMLAALTLCAGLPLLSTLVFTALNIALALFEDIYVFPRLLEGYDSYKLDTPFLLPIPHSLRSFFRGLH